MSQSATRSAAPLLRGCTARRRWTRDPIDGAFPRSRGGFPHVGDHVPRDPPLLTAVDLPLTGDPSSDRRFTRQHLIPYRFVSVVSPAYDSAFSTAAVAIAIAVPPVSPAIQIECVSFSLGEAMGVHHYISSTVPATSA